MKSVFLLTSFLLLHGLASVVMAQQQNPYQATFCEENQPFYYGIYPDLLREKKTILIKARLGKGETDNRINKIRYTQFLSVLSGNGGLIETEYAEGERLAGVGGLEIYENGKLLFFLKARRGCFINFKCCDCYAYTPILKKGKVNKTKECRW